MWGPLMTRSHGADFKNQPETLHKKKKTRQQQPNRKFLPVSSERKPTDFPSLCPTMVGSNGKTTWRVTGWIFNVGNPIWLWPDAEELTSIIDKNWNYDELMKKGSAWNPNTPPHPPKKKKNIKPLRFPLYLFKLTFVIRFALENLHRK